MRIPVEEIAMFVDLKSQLIIYLYLRRRAAEPLGQPGCSLVYLLGA